LNSFDKKQKIYSYYALSTNSNHGSSTYKVSHNRQRFSYLFLSISKLIL
jgi:hypothetical protein